MQPLPEIREALERLTELSGGDTDMVALLKSVSDLAVAVVPSCTGVSITITDTGGPFTMTATAEEFGVVDAAQYLDDGPCLECADQGEDLYVPDVLDEKQWQLTGEVAAARGVRSSLSLPLRDGDELIGALNLYSSERDGFDRKQRLIASIFGARVDEIVANADLSFMTRDFARELPERLAASSRIDEAVGMLMARRGWSSAEARERLTDAAARAGVAPDRLAEVLVELAMKA